MVFIAIAALVVLFSLNWWVMAFLADRVVRPGGRACAGVSLDMGARIQPDQMVYLLTLLLLWSYQPVRAQYSIEIGRLLLIYVLPGAAARIDAASSGQTRSDSAQSIDFFYS